MSTPLANMALLGAASRFAAEPKRWRDELATAVLHEVEGELYRQLNVAAGRALHAPAEHLPLAIEGLRELIRAIGAEANKRRTDRRQQEQARGAPLPLPPERETRLIRDPSNGETRDIGEDAA